MKGTGAGSVVHILTNDGFHPVEDTEIKAMYSKLGWNKIDGKWYYIDAEGMMARQMQKIDGKWYYFDSKGYMVTGTRTISGKEYTFDTSGACLNRKD